MSNVREERGMPVTVPARDASTVALLRDGNDAVEVWLLTRAAQMAFAAGMTVFPGGRVDPADAELPWTGRPVEEYAARLACTSRRARALVGAAVRETFEETGVLLCVPAGDLSAFRADVEAGLISFGDLLREHGLAADASRLRPWARWITPVGEPRRYDTTFFVAALPPGAEPADLTSESVHAGWIAVAEALAQHDRRERRMMPPTLSVLRAIGEWPAVDAVLAAADSRSLDPVRPVLHPDGVVELPDGSRVRLHR